MIDPYLVFTRAIDVHKRLLAVGIDNAIGGALSLGYHVDQPRGTQDIDVNISVTADRAEEVLRTLPDDVPWTAADVARVERDDQVRLMWPVTNAYPIPLDLFFIAGALHDVVRQRSIEVPMLDARVKVLSATDLTIFKALFGRGKDWPDIQSMLDAHDSTVDLPEAARWVASIVGDDDPRVRRLRAMRAG